MKVKLIIPTLITLICLTNVLFSQTPNGNDEQGLLYIYDAALEGYLVSRGEAVTPIITIPAVFEGFPVRGVQEQGFAGFANLTHIYLNSCNHLTEIGASAFEGCTSLIECSLPNSLTILGNSAFKGCTALVQIRLSNVLQTLGDESFSGCTSLMSLTFIPNSFANGIMLPPSLTCLGRSSFQDCSSIVSAIIPNSVIHIDNAAFKGCVVLANIQLSNALLVLGDEVFMGCIALYNINFAPSPNRQDLPPSLTSIGSRAFSGCTSISSITIPPNVTNIGYNPFEGCSEDIVIEFAPGNSEFSMDGNCLISVAENKVLTGFADSIIPSYIRIIGDYAFSNTSITEVDFPLELRSIGSFAFAGCGALETIQLPNTLEAIGENAFSDCSSLDTILIPNRFRDDLHRNTAIGERVFANCTNLTTATLPLSFTTIANEMFINCTSLVTFNISENVVSIGAYAFANCNTFPLIVIPENVEVIGYYAFSGCNELVIHAQVESQPAGWDANFNPDGCQVQWNTSSHSADEVMLAVTQLYASYPNPFNPSTTIAFNMGSAGHVAIDVYNAKGQRVKSLVDEVCVAGSHKIVWNGEDQNGHNVGSGVYFYRMTTNGYSNVKKMVMMK